MKNLVKVVNIKKIFTIFKTKKGIIFSFITILAVVLLSASAFFGKIAISNIKNFDGLEANFQNAHKIVNTSLKTNKPFDLGFNYDEKLRNPDSIYNDENKIALNKNLSTKILDYKDACKGLESEMFSLLLQYGGKWNELRDIVKKFDPVLMKYSAGKILMGEDGTGKNSGFINDLINTSNYYVNDVYPATGNDKINNFETYLIGNKDQPQLKSVAELIQHYCVKEFASELGIYDYNKDQTSNILSKDITKSSIDKNMLVSLMLNRILMVSSSEYFTSLASGPAHFFNDYKDYSIKKSVFNLGYIASSYAFLNLGSFHMVDVNSWISICDALNYIMFQAASKIFIDKYFENVDKYVNIFNEARQILLAFYKEEVLYQTIQTNGYNPGQATYPVINFYCNPNLTADLNSTLSSKTNDLGNLFNTDLPIWNDRDLFNSSELYTGANTLRGVFEENALSYTNDGQCGFDYFQIVDKFFHSYKLWV